MTKEEYYELKYRQSVTDRRLQNERREKEQKERELAKQKQDRKNFVTGADGKGSIFRIILLMLLMISLLRVLLQSEFTVSLGGFLEYFVNVPDVSMSWLSGVDLTIYADWGVFEFFRIFVNSISNVLEIAIILVGGIIQLVTYLAYILGYIFL